MYTRVLTITTIYFALLMQSIAANADCLNPEHEPFKEQEKLVCWIKRDNSISYDGALIAPLNEGGWVGWLYQTIYYAEPIKMKETYNDCTGLGLVGERSGQVYSLSVEAIKAELTGTITEKESLDNVSFKGECQVLTEDEWSLNVLQQTDIDEP